MLIGGLSIANKAAPNDYGTLGIILDASTAISCVHVMVHAPPSDGQVVLEPAGGKSPQYDIGKAEAINLLLFTHLLCLCCVVGIVCTPTFIATIANMGQL